MMRLFQFPVQIGHHRVSFHDGFGDPRQADERAHLAIDIGSQLGTQVFCATNGEVVRRCVLGGQDLEGVGFGRKSGNFVIITDTYRNFFLYAHMRDRAVVRPGQKLTAGQLIGFMGDSGRAGHVHLHFQVWVPFAHAGADEEYRDLTFSRRFGRAINPFSQLETLAVKLPGARRTRGLVDGREVGGVIIDPVR